MARSSGLKKDLRVLNSTTYGYYFYLSFRTFLGKLGDCYDRFIIRIREMLESINIIYQLIPDLSFALSFKKSNTYLDYLVTEPFLNSNFTKKNISMESLIEHFKHYSEGLKVPSGVSYASVEAPKGEFGCTLVSDNSFNPFRCKIRTPAYHHLNFMAFQMEGHFMADMITILGSQDIVFGEVDR